VKDDFSDRFAVLCELNELTCTTLAKRVKVAESMASRWLRGDQKPRNRADIVKRALGMSLAELYSADLAEAKKKIKARAREAS
jgi:ribosome-binding protein aMBF1 (putative translation factor)